MFDKSKKYYKIFNKKDNHHGLQYHDGLIIDPIPFNNDPDESCVEGGLYFSDADNICKFLHYGDYIREVEIPKYTKVVKDPDDNKWRANKRFLHKRKNLTKASTWKWMIKQGINIHYDNDYPLRWAIEYRGFDIVKFLIENNADIHYGKEFALRWAARNGHVDIVKFLVENNADIHACDDYALKWSVNNGHKEIVDYIKSLK